MVSLRAIDDANREAIEALRVSPAQLRFASGVAESLLEAAEEPGARALYWAIYEDETPVGFVMIADEVDSPSTSLTIFGSCSSTSATNDGVLARQRST
jgi:diamine N-acetyltransferase